jgi:hypothetical protein
MSGWWMVEVTSPINGDVYFASRAYGSDVAQFEHHGDAEDLVEEILWYYENTFGLTDVKIAIVFMNEHGLVQGKVMA